MGKNKNIQEAGFIKQIVLFLILIALIFFGFNVYKNIRQNTLSKEGIKESVNQTIEEQKRSVEETTEKLIEDSKKSISEKLKEKMGEIIDSILRVKKDNPTE